METLGTYAQVFLNGIFSVSIAHWSKCSVVEFDNTIGPLHLDPECLNQSNLLNR